MATDKIESDAELRARARKTEILRVRVTADMHRHICRAAAALGVRSTTFVRGAVENRVLGLSDVGRKDLARENARLRAQLDAIREVLEL